ncbi:unnamed protein product [Paramecium pentaurelia]|uniref:Transmembrane protein n=1 Tax=Paramecium pentaurelia TaxID=43138 RepID=A0A8S1W2E7_9CILI|nr:unnamed protein product [Paramecium pentaurelia]
MFNYTNIGFLSLKIIAFLCILIGYFMNSQELNKAQKNTGNPLFLDKKDFFYYVFSRIVLIVDETFTGFDTNDVYYHIDSQFNINYEILYNTVIHGISPIAQLQYWNIQYQTLDSVTYQLKKQNKTSYLSSYKAYADYDPFSQFQQLNDGSELITKLNKNDFAFYYIDNLQLSSIEYDNLLTQVDNNTMIIILKFDKVYFYTNRTRLSKDEHTKTIYSIDSLTSTISCLLDTPIPLENHGMILPGLFYETTPAQDINQIQLLDYMMNLYQLYEHYTLIEKKKSIKYQKDLDLFKDQFELVSTSKDDKMIQTYLNTLKNEIKELAVAINSEISGNFFVLLLGLFLCLYILYLIFFRQQELVIIDWYIIGLTITFAFIEINLFKITLFLVLLLRMKQPVIQSLLGFLLLISDFPFYQLISIGSLVYLFIKNKDIILTLLKTKQNLLKYCIGIFIIIILSTYVRYLLIIFIPLIIFLFRKHMDVTILLVCCFCRAQNLLPILLLSFQYFKENEQSYFKYPAYLIIDILYITVTHPVLPNSPILCQIDGYLHLMDIIILICLQQMYYHFTTEINSNLEINEKSIITSIQKITEYNVEYFDNIILQLIIEIIWIIELMLTEIFCYDMKQIGNQYFTLQFLCLNLFMLLFYVIKEGGGRIIEQEYEKAQNKQELETKDMYENQMREIEI